jgi:predicted tellurium resistance membrane protein TerC
VLLIWIGIKLLLPEDDEGEGITPADHLWGAVRTIIIADFVMSLDNVIGVAGAAHGNLALLLFGLAVSIPLIVWSSQLILHWMERWPVVVTLGAALLGFVAGEMMLTDGGVTALLPEHSEWMVKAAGITGAILVVVTGKWLESRQQTDQDITIV